MKRNATIMNLGIWGAHDLETPTKEREIAISAHGNYIAVRPALRNWEHKDRFAIFVYNTSGALICSTKNPNGGERGLSFWPDENHLLMPGHNPTGMATGKGPSALKLWRLGGNNFSFPFIDEDFGYGNQVYLFGVSRTGRYVITNLGCFDTYSNTAVCESHGSYVFASNDKFVAVNRNSDPRYLDSSHLEIFETTSPAAPDGTRSTDSSHLEIFETTEWNRLWDGSEFCLTFSPDCQYVATSLFDSELRIRSVDSFDIVAAIGKLPNSNSYDYYTAAEYTSDGQILFTGSRNGHLCVWDIEKQTCLERIEHAHTYPITQMKFSPANNELITTDNERIVIWQL
ncbi:MAG: hypothetical protein KF753_14305 [Caldilineaceae bacterium]|nr:hypothetical protein [Caldilineaceae bacterium]